jgi:Leucine-rich repeat (LRR) protein
MPSKPRTNGPDPANVRPTPRPPRWHSPRRGPAPALLLAVLLLAISTWLCWPVLAYYSAVSEVERSATWTDMKLANIIWPRGASGPAFRGLTLFKGRDFESIGHLLPRLRPTSVEAEECMDVDLDAFQGLTDLRSIGLRSCPALQNIDGLKGLSCLRSLGLGKCLALRNVDALGGLTGLQYLSISGCTSLRNADSFTGLTSLESLTLVNCGALQNVDAIKGLTRLKTLALIDCEALRGADAIKTLNHLETVDLIRCTQLSSSSVRDIRAALPNTAIIFLDRNGKAPDGL